MDANYILSSSFMLAILIILGVSSFRLIQTQQGRKRCLALFIATACYVLADFFFILCHFNHASWPVEVWRVVAIIFELVYVALPFVWHIFLRNFVGRSYPDIVRKLEFIPLLVLVVLVIVSIPTGIIFSVGENGYSRGPDGWYYFFTFFNCFYFFEAFIDLIVIAIRKKYKSEPYCLQAAIITTIPLAATIVNNVGISFGTIFPFLPFCWTGTALLAFFFMAFAENQAVQKNQRAVLQNALDVAEEAKAKAQEASRVKTVFLSNMSHDIRTPMNAIINLTKLAQEESDPNKVKEYLDKLSVSGNFLLGLINDILDMSRIESGEFTLHKEPLTKKEFVYTIDTVIGPLMHKKGVAFHNDIVIQDVAIMVDKLRFNQIFFNLLSNAEKFTPEGGEVWFSIIHTPVVDNKIVITAIVRDTGIGMSEAFLARLFEPFAQEHSGQYSSRQGTGLGLAIVSRLVKAMNGEIKVNSKLGEGSEFIVTLPVEVAKEEDAAIEMKISKDIDLKGIKVLLVEDNDLNIYVTKTILTKEGVEVDVAKDGQEGVDAFARSAAFYYDAILMDVRMPKKDGIEATKEIRALDREDAKTIKIIAMTADAFDEERKKTLDSGMDFHLPKPVDARALTETLGQCRKGKKGE